MGSVIVHGQKVPLHRYRIRHRNRRRGICVYELFRRKEEMQRKVWPSVMRGVTIAGYDPAIVTLRIQISIFPDILV